MNRRLLTLLVLALSFTVISCGDDAEDPPPADPYLPQTSEDNVLDNFQQAYRTRDIEAYSRLLSADFQFYFDPSTRDQLGISFWTRTQDSLQTGTLFGSPEVKKIAIELDWQRGSAVKAGLLPPRNGWTQLFITDVYLDVDFAPVGQEEVTFRVENQQQRFYFRRGRTYPPSGPADTLVYLVEWRDMGTGSSFGRGSQMTSGVTTWSSIKGLISQ